MSKHHTVGRRARSAGLLLCALLVAPFAQAAGDDGGFYLGAQLYNARFSDAGEFGGEDLSGGLTVGWQFNRVLGIEASAKKTHLTSMSVDPSGKGVHGIELALRGRHDFNDRFALTAKVGAYDWQRGGQWPYLKSGTDPVVGAGLELRMSAHTAFTTEYQRIIGFAGADEDSQVGLGVRIDFH
jgi:hypothetical protein